MSRLLKSTISIFITLALCGVSAWSLTAKNINFGGQVSFDTTGIIPGTHLDIAANASLDGSTVDDYFFSLTYSTLDAPDWQIPDITLSLNKNTVSYSFSFVNKSDFPVYVNFTPPTDVPGHFSFSGGSLETGSDNLFNTAVAAGQASHFVFYLKLTEFTNSINYALSLNIGFST